MVWDIAVLESDFRRRVELLELKVVTHQETAWYLLMVSCFAMLQYPNQWAIVFQALKCVPATLLSEVATELAAKKRANGEWEWPPVGAIGSEPSQLSSGITTSFRLADSHEVRVYEALGAWLSKEVSKE